MVKHWRWLVPIGVLALGFAGQQAHAAEGPDRFFISERVVPDLPSRAQTPQLSHAYARVESHPIQFHVGQAVAFPVVGLGAALVLGGFTSMGSSSLAARASVPILHLGGITAGIGAGASLGAAASLRRDGFEAPSLPGWIAVGAATASIGSILLVPVDERIATYGALLAPVTVSAALFQVGLTSAAGRRARLRFGVVPTPHGVTPVVQGRF